ncbi:hypothetical protein MASR2M70_00660 [Bacillota bacterium]
MRLLAMARLRELVLMQILAWVYPAELVQIPIWARECPQEAAQIRREPSPEYTLFLRQNTASFLVL